MERIILLRTRANAGDVNSMRELAFALRHGHGTEKNLPEAFKWYFKAATFGDSESILAVAEMFREGLGTPADTTKAVEYYKKIFNDRHAHICDRRIAASRIADIYEQANDGAQALLWLKQLNFLGKVEARFKIAEIFRDGCGNVQPDGERAIACLKEILDDETLLQVERCSAAFELGKIFHAGTAVERDDKTAIKFFTLATEAGIPLSRDANIAIAEIYFDGADVDNALKFLSAASDAGSRKATWLLAEIYRDGKFGVKQNSERALAVLRKVAAEKFDVLNKVIALRKSAEIFSKGLGVPVDKKKADELYREASELNKKWFHALNNIQSL